MCGESARLPSPNETGRRERNCRFAVVIGPCHRVRLMWIRTQSSTEGRGMKRQFVTAVLTAVFAGILLPAIAFGAPTWAPASSATVHPGVQTFTDGGQCTANFVFYDASGAEYIGQAAHCSGTDGNTATDGCTSGSLPTGTPVEVDGASKPGTMVYNSWVTMQQLGEKDPDTCAYNDLALVKLDPAD